MQSNSRTIVSVVGTVMMVVMTVLLATWSPPQSETSVQPANGATIIIGGH
jgi:flagellin-like protein